MHTPPPPERSATSIDVAREAGVSQATVSRVLNGSPRVSAEVRADVEKAIRKLGYRPNLAARSLVTNRTRSIGVVLGDLRNSYYVELLDTITADIEEAGYRPLVLSNHGGDADDLAELLWEASVDGIIVLTSLLAHDEEQRLVSLGIPAVTLGPDRVEGADSLAPDNTEGGRIAARHLADLGHRRIGILTGPLAAASVRDKHEGFLAELADRGISVEPEHIRPGELQYATAYDAALELLGHADRPTAVYCHNDLMAFAVLNAATALGLRVPEDLSVIGFDDVEMAAWESFRLTTVRQPIRDMAAGAAELLLGRLATPGLEARTVLLPCSLVERATTAPPA